MATWSKGAIRNAIPFWKPEKPELDPTVLQNLNVPIEQDLKMMFPPNFKERLKRGRKIKDRAGSLVEDITSMPRSQNNDYLNQAEQLMFQINQIQNKASARRLKKTLPIFKPGPVIMNTYPVDIPIPTPIFEKPGGVPGYNVSSKNPGTGIFKDSSVLNSLKPGQLSEEALRLIGAWNPKKAKNLKSIGAYTPGKGPQPFMQFLNAIAGKESGGNYGARNTSSGAMGKYQIMPANIAGPGGWDREALGREITPAQFMASPKLQEAIARYKLAQYYKKYGAAGAASAWYSGSPTSYKSSSDIGGYVSSILRALGG